MTLTKNNTAQIIGGQHRGRKFNFADVEGLRPTPNKVRETLFNWLQFETSGKTFLDLFAGSGALSFEAFSRGAKSVVSVERNVDAFEFLQKNKRLLKADNLTIFNRDAFDFLSEKNGSDVLWIAHAARNDVEVLYRVSGRLPARVFDTQIAVDLLQHLRLEGSTGGQISYQAITEILQGVILEKTYTRLDWSVRPLPEGAVQYALDDVVYLIRNYAQLKTLLESEGKLDWLMEDGQAMLDIHIYNPNIFQSWTRVKGFNRLPKHLHNLGVQLAGWREQTAIKKNKPRRWILSDDDLINIAMEKRHLSNDKQQNFDNFIAKNPCNIEIDTSKRVPTAEEKSQKLILQKLIQEKANQYNLNAEVITNGKTLLRYIRNDRSVNFLSGWRYDLLKEELEKCKTV